MLAALPIAGTATVMSNCDDLDSVFENSVNQIEREVQKNKSAPTLTRDRVTLRKFSDAFNGMLNFTHEFGRRALASLEIPVRRGCEFRLRSGMKLNLCHSAARTAR